MSDPSKYFSEFPKFTNLTYAHRDIWNELIKDMPAYADFSYPSLMNWWSSLEPCKVALLNSNAVISYWIPGDVTNSGLSLIGKQKLDESICTIFDWQKRNGDEPRLVHVPDFVIENLKYPEMFTYNGNRDYDECIVAVKKFSDIETMPFLMKSRVRRFLTEVSTTEINVIQLDLNDRKTVEELLEVENVWINKKQLNDISALERECFLSCVKSADKLGVSCIGFYVKGRLQSFILHTLKEESEYANFNFFRFSYELPRLFDVCVHIYAKWYQDHDIKYLNIDNDFGNQKLRAVKLMLGANNYFRKYELKPR